MNYRENAEKREFEILSDYAAKSSLSKGRNIPQLHKKYRRQQRCSVCAE